MDTAAKAGLRLSCFLQLLSEFLVCACETDSPVSPNSTELAFHFLDNCLRICMDQFIRISSLSTAVRRTNVLEAIFLPSDGAKARLESLPLLGTDLFNDKFQEAMEAEAKRLEAADRINLQKPATTVNIPVTKGNKQATRSTCQQFPRKPLRSFRGRGRSLTTNRNPSGRAQDFSNSSGGSFANSRRRTFRPTYTPRTKTSYGTYRQEYWRK